MSWKPSKTFKSVTKVFTPKNIITGVGYMFGGVGGAVVGNLLGGEVSKKFAGVNGSGAIQTIDRAAENAKKARAKLLYTEGGILGADVNSVQKSERNLFGN